MRSLGNQLSDIQKWSSGEAARAEHAGRCSSRTLARSVKEYPSFLFSVAEHAPRLPTSLTLPQGVQVYPKAQSCAGGSVSNLFDSQQGDAVLYSLRSIFWRYSCAIWDDIRWSSGYCGVAVLQQTLPPGQSDCLWWRMCD